MPDRPEDYSPEFLRIYQPDFGPGVRQRAERWLLGRELRRILMLIEGEDWETTYEDLIVSHGLDIPTAEELDA